jgi:hypothetical protein
VHLRSPPLSSQGVSSFLLGPHFIALYTMNTCIGTGTHMCTHMHNIHRHKQVCTHMQTHKHSHENMHRHTYKYIRHTCKHTTHKHAIHTQHMHTHTETFKAHTGTCVQMYPLSHTCKYTRTCAHTSPLPDSTEHLAVTVCFTNNTC